MTTLATILADNPTLLLALGDAAGSASAADASGNGHAAAASGITFGVADADSGDAGTGATAGSSTATLTVPASPALNLGTGAFTWLGFARLTSSVGGTQLLAGSNAAAAWWVGVSGNKLSWSFGSGSGTATGTGGVALNDGKDDLLVVRRSAAGAVTTSVDAANDSAGAGTFAGQLGASTQGVGVLNFDNPTPGPFGFTGGTLKYAALFVGTALTDAQVAAIYAAETTAASVAIPVADPNWQHAPFNTFGNGPGTLAANGLAAGSTVAAILAEGGSPASLTIANTGNVTFTLDMSRLAAVGLAASQWPVVSFSVDGGPWADLTLVAGQTAYQIVNGGAVGTHNVRYRVKSNYSPSTNDGASKWVPTGSPALPPFAVVVTGATADAGASTVPQAAAAGGVDLFLGDSLTEGVRVYSASDLPSANDSANWVAAVASTYNSSFGQLGYGGIGYGAAGIGGVPQFNQSSGLYFQGVSRLDANGLYQPQPTRVWVCLGTNGATAQADVAQAIALTRARAPSARVNMLVPPGGFARAATAAAVAACGDANVKLADAGTGFQVGLTGLVSGGTARSFDGLHLNATASGPAYAAAVTAATAGPAGSAAAAAPDPVAVGQAVWAYANRSLTSS